jgi:hypothetical protein
MFKFLFMIAVVAGGVWVFLQALPDLERYMKIRSM